MRDINTMTVEELKHIGIGICCIMLVCGVIGFILLYIAYKYSNSPFLIFIWIFEIIIVAFLMFGSLVLMGVAYHVIRKGVRGE